MPSSANATIGVHKSLPEALDHRTAGNAVISRMLRRGIFRVRPGPHSGEASHPDGKETARSLQVGQAIMVDDPSSVTGRNWSGGHSGRCLVRPDPSIDETRT